MKKVNNKTLTILAAIVIVLGSFATLSNVIACVSVTDQFGNTGGCTVNNIYTDKSVTFTKVATSKTATAATLNGVYVASDMYDQSCQAFFDLGVDRNAPQRIALGQLVKTNTATNFSKRLTNLQPNTTYFYRTAVACNNGMRYGETSAFKTTSNTTAYVAPKKAATYKAPAKKVSYAAPAKTTTTKVAGKTVVNCDCADKFLSLAIENLDTSVQAGRQNNFRITYKSVEKENLSNLTLKVTLPEELKLVGASAGEYTVGGSELLLNIPSIAADQGVEIFITTIANPSVKTGDKVMLNAKVNYTADNVVKNGNVFSGETKAYTLIMVDNSQVPAANLTGNVTSDTDTTTTTTNSYVPKTLLEWLITLLVLSIFFGALRYFITLFREVK